MSLVSIAIGVGLGFLFSKLFLMIVSSLLAVEEPLAFVLVPKAFVYTIVGFFFIISVIITPFIVTNRKCRGSRFTKR